MKISLNKLFLFVIIAIIIQSCTSNSTLYFNQKQPSSSPELFAPNIINTNQVEINTVFNDSYTELFFTRIINGKFIIHHSELKNEKWTKPQPIQLFLEKDLKSVAIDPSITKDGKTMYFLGISPKDRVKKSKPDVYKSEKVNGKWQLATKVESISTETYAESYPVVVSDGSVYFESDIPNGFGKRDIYKSQYLGNGNFDKPKNLGAIINTKENARSTYVSPDESYLITSNDDGFQVSFKQNGKWTKPKLIESIPFEDDWIYCCPYMSPDEKYFFFSKRYSNPPKSGWKNVTEGHVLWVDAEVIFKLKP